MTKTAKEALWKARRKAVFSMDREFYKKHMEVWKNYYKGLYMSDKFIDIMIHKETYFAQKAKRANKQEAKEWLVEHGYSLDY